MSQRDEPQISYVTNHRLGDPRVVIDGEMIDMTDWVRSVERRLLTIERYRNALELIAARGTSEHDRNLAREALDAQVTPEFRAAQENAHRTEAMAQAMQRGRRV